MTTYLDYAGIGLVRPAARAAMHAAVDGVLAAGSGQYGEFFGARGTARERAAALLDCHPDEVALIGNTSTGVHLVADGLDWRSGDEVVLFDRDFPANVQPWRRLTEYGVRLRWVPMRGGGYDLDDIAAVVGPATRVVAVSQVNFVTGFRMDLDAVCALAAPHGTLVFVDAAQSLGVLPLALSHTPIDFLAAGGHKWLCGPPGTGIFFCRRDRLPLLRRAPLGWFGYDRSDEMLRLGEGRFSYDLEPRPAARRFEGGMLNFVGIVGLATALEELAGVGVDKVWARVRTLVDTLGAGLRECGYAVAGRPDDAATSGIVSFSAGQTNADSARLHATLVERGCRCSYPDGRVRLSPHYWTSDADMEGVLALLRIVRSTY